ncbi:DUF421 domain-containing protein [Paenibacillus sp. N3/727]|uniref:DUF421 domain-containing protein n=1 Tax=Paenibacillus sp. N3/727 TaxID=2925845 RepID=UPI001F536D84|nr:DUF421 domain-containing protein [Paenibacillus sp. N3/727]UNK19064.1 DUF421 domain-containing protein [Paenibacillus sp. N3/727]
MIEHLIILLRSISAFVLLLLITRILGKQTLSNMNFHEFVTAIIMGAIAANLAFNDKMKVVYLIISLVVFTATSFILTKTVLKSRKLRMWVEGTPTVLIEGGKILEDNLKKNNLTMDSLNQMLRQKDIFDLNEVEYVLLEVNGKISVMKKREYKSTILKDLKKGISSAQQFPIELIMDGQVLHGNFDANHISREWLTAQLKLRGKREQDVFYAVKGSNGQLYIDFYNDKIKHPIDVE